MALLAKRTGTINKVEKKLQRNSRRNDSDGRIFPSILIIFGTSGMRLIAALKKASAARQKKSPHRRTLKNSVSVFFFTGPAGPPESSVEVRPRRGPHTVGRSCKRVSATLTGLQNIELRGHCCCLPSPPLPSCLHRATQLKEPQTGFNNKVK